MKHLKLTLTALACTLQIVGASGTGNTEDIKRSNAGAREVNDTGTENPGTAAHQALTEPLIIRTIQSFRDDIFAGDAVLEGVSVRTLGYLKGRYGVQRATVTSEALSWISHFVEDDDQVSAGFTFALNQEQFDSVHGALTQHVDQKLIFSLIIRKLLRDLPDACGYRAILPPVEYGAIHWSDQIELQPIVYRPSAQDPHQIELIDRKYEPFTLHLSTEQCISSNMYVDTFRPGCTPCNPPTENNAYMLTFTVPLEKIHTPEIPGGGQNVTIEGAEAAHTCASWLTDSFRGLCPRFCT